MTVEAFALSLGSLYRKQGGDCKHLGVALPHLRVPSVSSLSPGQHLSGQPQASVAARPLCSQQFYLLVTLKVYFSLCVHANVWHACAGACEGWRRVGDAMELTLHTGSSESLDVGAGK